MTSEAIIGIRFFSGTAAAAVDEALTKKGLIVIPAAPALVKLNYDDEYRHALQTAELVIPDSALLARLAHLVCDASLHNISAAAYTRKLVSHLSASANGTSVWIFASDETKQRALNWLRDNGLLVDEELCYVRAQAPSKSHDHELLLKIEQLRPGHVIVAFAGGAHEALGLYLRDYLVYRPAIHCIGSSMALLTGEEKAIPSWAERYDLGWMARLLSQPAMLLPRIGMAAALCLMVLWYRAELPPLRKRWTDV